MEEEERRPSTFQEQGPGMLLPPPWEREGRYQREPVCEASPVTSLAAVQPEAADAYRLLSPWTSQSALEAKQPASCPRGQARQGLPATPRAAAT